MGIFGSVFEILGDVVDVADAVVSIPLAVVKPVTGAIAEAAQTVKEEIEDLIED